LMKYYQNAKLFIFASIDDFWMTPIEAMACWIPILAIEKWWVLETVIWEDNPDLQTWFFYKNQSSEDILEKLIWIKKNKFLEWEKFLKLQKNSVKQAKNFSKKNFEEKNFLELEKNF
jgi:glycosyltransferase involved in cell wall biosynthesis